MAVGCALLTASGILALLLNTTDVTLLLISIALVGAGAHTTLILVTTAIADSYPSAVRSTAIGWALGVGRLGAVVAPSLGGLILSTGLGPQAVFLTFVVSALISACMMTALVVHGKRSDLAVSVA